MSLVIIGSLAFDTITTPLGKREKIIGGSCSYAALAASYFTNPKMVAVAGKDFPEETIQLFKQRGVDTRALEIKEGKTFHWEGAYGEDPNQRTTVKTELNVFQDFKPKLLPDYRKAGILFLGNIDPDLQMDILNQAENPRLVAMDTINLWIESKPEPLREVIKNVNVFFANDEEVRMISREKNLLKAGRRLLEMGPSHIVIKKGEHGVLLMEKDFIFGMLAHPCEDVIDPTGAGDSFAGGFLGYLDKIGSSLEKDFRRASVYGSVMASFTIEDFSIERLKSLSDKEIESRYELFRDLVTF